MSQRLTDEPFFAPFPVHRGQVWTAARRSVCMPVQSRPVMRNVLLALVVCAVAAPAYRYPSAHASMHPCAHATMHP